MSPKGITMATYALCGFANFSSIAIQIGGIAPMAPHRKKDIAALGLKAVLGGSLATLMTATLAGHPAGVGRPSAQIIRRLGGSDSSVPFRGRVVG